MRRSLSFLVLLTLFVFSFAALAFAVDKYKPKQSDSSGTQVKVEILGEKASEAQDKDVRNQGAKKKHPAEDKASGRLVEEERDKDKAEKRAKGEKSQGKPQADKRGQGKTKGKDKELKIKVRGKNAKFDVPPVIKGGRMLIPVRAVTQSLGAKVDYDAATGQVTITKGETTVIITLGSRQILVNGVPQELDVPAQAINNRTFVPLRFLAEIFGQKVDYDAEKGEVIIGEEEGEEEQAEADGEADEEANRAETSVRVHIVGPLLSQSNTLVNVVVGNYVK